MIDIPEKELVEMVTNGFAKEIPDFEGYLATIDGRIISNKKYRRRNAGYLQANLDNYGYLQVFPNNKNHRKCIKVHRLVAKTFIENIHDYPQINHKNEVKTDNRVENLEWCTAKQNANYGTRIFRTLKKVNRHKRGNVVGQYSMEGELVHIWTSSQQASRYGYNQSRISRCANGIVKSHKGYKWKYI